MLIEVHYEYQTELWHHMHVLSARTFQGLVAGVPVYVLGCHEAEHLRHTRE